MKSIYTFALLNLVSISSYSCPSLSGLWSCQDNLPIQKLDLSQVEGQYTLRILEEGEPEAAAMQFILDGQKYELDDGFYSAKCDVNSVTIEGLQYLDASKKESFGIKFKYTLTDDNTMDLRVLETGESDKAFQEAAITVCKRTFPLN